MSYPIPFEGTMEERMANHATHHWAQLEGPEEPDRCVDCDCKSWHITAYWPCGTEVPRD